MSIKRQQIQRKLLLFALFSSILLTTPLAINYIRTTFSVIETPITPFFTSRANYDVYDEYASQLLYSYQHGDIPKIRFDQDNRYPGISVFVSDPFLCDSSGNEYQSLDESLFDGNRIESYTFQSDTGEFKFLQSITMGFDVAIRTHSNFNIKYYTYKTDGLWDYSYGGVNNVLRSGDYYAFGVLYARVAHDLQEWASGGATCWCVTGGEFKKSLVPNPTHDKYGSTISSGDNGITSGLYPDLPLISGEYEDQYLTSCFGNKRVFVQPDIDFTVIDDILSYDYFKPVEGTDDKFQIFSKDTQIGIWNVRQSSIRQHGFVDDAAVTGLAIEETFQDDSIEDDGFDKQLLDDDDVQQTWNDEYVPGSTDVFFLYESNKEVNKPFNNYVLPDNYLVVKNADGSDFKTIGLDIDNFLLPREVSITPSIYLQPMTTVKYATFKSNQVGHIHGWLMTDVVDTIFEMHPDVPYGIRITNTYAIARILVDLVILSNNEVTYIPATGESIKVEDLTEFGIDEFGILPNEVGIVGIHKEIAWWDGLFGGGNLTIIIIIVIAIIGIIITIQIIRGIGRGFRSRGYQGSFDIYYDRPRRRGWFRR